MFLWLKHIIVYTKNQNYICNINNLKLKKMEDELKSCNIEIDSIVRKKVGIISRNFEKKQRAIYDNYKMGLIGFNEYLEQIRDNADINLTILNKELDHKTEIV